MHGQQVTVPSDRDHFHIAHPMKTAREIIAAATEGDMDPVEIREGMYSQIRHRGCDNEFEWDGWRGHE
jgi:hypothetical protein